MAGFGDRGRKLLEAFARRLCLGAPRLGWHVARDRVAEYVVALAMVSATLGRIADEVRTLSRPELGEVEEAWRHGKVGSSTMPHKRNPERLQQVVVLARLTRANASLGLEGMLQEHERDSRGTRLEWLSVPEVSHFTLAAFAILGPILLGLRVHRQHMATEARRAAEQLCSEALMLALGRHLGKQSAHELVYDLSQAAQSHGSSLRQSLVDRPDIAGLLSPDELDMIFDPAQHLGLSGEMVDDAVAGARQWLDR